MARKKRKVPSAITIEGLHISYGDNKVIKGIDLDLPQGQVTAIIGPSGCGKTTLLRSLNRLSEMVPRCKVEGKIYLDGEDIFQMDPMLLRRRVGMVFQRPNPFPMSLKENILYGVKATGSSEHKQIKNDRKKTGAFQTMNCEGNGHKSSRSNGSSLSSKIRWPWGANPETAQLVESSLRKAALWEEVKDRLGDNAFSLSLGQQQRLCMARSLAISPKVILMDEPAASLDPLSTSKLEASILSMKGDYSVIIVTHNMQQAQRISDYTVYMYMGKVVECGRTTKVFENPEHKETRDYISGKS
ncbi:MAG: phosphate ABC transporter ATP-binding protein [Chloroflexota bacterium]|nr:phosphate ABC transporter ATP-binding protein [Chloroflexota bacterium]